MNSRSVRWKGNSYWAYGSGETGILVHTGSEYQKAKKRYRKWIKEKYSGIKK